MSVKLSDNDKRTFIFRIRGRLNPYDNGNKKRRVAELLSNDIPDDEAFLMRNGRYACTVCGHRPVFDTVDMLAVHRQGKKHQTCLDRHYAHKRRFALEVLKRKQEIEIRNEDEKGKSGSHQVEAPLLQKTRITVRNALLKAAPYNSRSKSQQHHKQLSMGTSSEENKGLFFQSTRRQHLQMAEQIASQSNETDVIQATKTEDLPGNPTHEFSSSCDPLVEGNIQQKEDELKKMKEKKRLLFAKEEVVKRIIELKAYVPKSKRKTCGKAQAANSTDQSISNHSITDQSIVDRPHVHAVQATSKSVSYISYYQQNSQGSASKQGTKHGTSNLLAQGSVSKQNKSSPKESGRARDNCSTAPQLIVHQSTNHSVRQPPGASKEPLLPPYKGNTKTPSTCTDFQKTFTKTPVPSQDNVKKEPSHFNLMKYSTPIQFSIKRPSPSPPSHANVTASVSSQDKANKMSLTSQMNVKKTSATLQVDVKKTAALEQIQLALAGKKTEKPNPDKSSHSAVLPEGPCRTDVRRRELQHHLHLTSSGWKRDNGGNWIKDDEAEFDSDEEEPPQI